jgi:hypothetical protein
MQCACGGAGVLLKRVHGWLSFRELRAGPGSRGYVFPSRDRHGPVELRLTDQDPLAHACGSDESFLPGERRIG